MASMLDVKWVGSGFEGHFQLLLIRFVEINVNSTKSSKYDKNLILWFYAQKIHYFLYCTSWERDRTYSFVQDTISLNYSQGKKPVTFFILLIIIKF